MGAGPSMAMQAAMSAAPDTAAGTSEEAQAQDVRRLRWILQVANSPGSCEEWYLGDEQDGLRHGQGAAFYTSGDVYHGQWHKGAWHGRGTLTHMSGAKYTGNFEKGEQHGSGEFVEANGVRYQGEFRRGRQHGPGLMVSASGAQFEGWFRDGLPNGDGVLTWPDGGKFIGKYVAGKEHGRGQILDPFGCKICDVECASGVLVGGRTVCPGSHGAGKGPKCRGGSKSCGFCLQTALDLELSIAQEKQPDSLQATSWRSSGGTGVGHSSSSSRSRTLTSGDERTHPSSTQGSALGGGGGGGGGGMGFAASAAGGDGAWNNRRVVRIKARPTVGLGVAPPPTRPSSTVLDGMWANHGNAL